MVDAPFDAYLDTPNKSIRQAVPRKGVVLHHAAMTSLSGLESLTMGGKQVSSNAIAKDRISKRLMADRFRAWSLSSAWGDSSFRSVETCNESTDGWTVSDESHWELAYLVAYWAVLDGFYPHRNGDPKSWTVIGHREAYTIWDISYGTACPGGMDLDLVTSRAQGLLRSSSVAGDVVVDLFESEEDSMAKIIYRREGGKPVAWSLVGPNGDATGCRETRNQDTANAWARIYGPAVLIPTKAEYARVQAEARAIAATKG